MREKILPAIFNFWKENESEPITDEISKIRQNVCFIYYLEDNPWSLITLTLISGIGYMDTKQLAANHHHVRAKGNIDQN
jgi:hypothetical protein